MSLREEMLKYEQITGESAEHVPIIKLGAFLDGYEMAINNIIIDAKRKKDVIYTFGYKEGYKEGYKDGVNDFLDCIERKKKK